MLKRHKSSRSRPKLIRRPKRKPAGPIRGGLFAGCEYTVTASSSKTTCGRPWRARRSRRKRDDDASGAGEDAVPNDGDDQVGAGAVRSPTGRWALRSSRNVDRLRPEGRKIYLDDENDACGTTRTMSCGGFATRATGAASQSASTSGCSCSPRRQTVGCGSSPTTWPRRPGRRVRGRLRLRSPRVD